MTIEYAEPWFDGEIVHAYGEAMQALREKAGLANDPVQKEDK